MPEAAGVQENKEHTMTKAELVEEVTRITELPRKESEAVVETIFDSIIAALRPTIKSKSEALEAFGRVNGGAAQDEIRKRARKWKCHRRKFLTSSPAKS